MLTRFDVPLGGIVRIPFASYDSNGASVTMTGLTVEDVRIFKDGALEERGPDAGYTVFTNFDSRTGLHIVEIDTSEDDSPVGFWTDGSEYHVAIDAVTIDSQTVRLWAAWFRVVAVTDISDVHSLLTVVNTIVSDIQSDTNKIVSDVTEGDTSDILSRLTVTNSQILIIKSDTSDVLSRLTSYTAAAGILSDINSGVDVIQAGITTGGGLFELVSDVFSDTTIISSDTTVIEAWNAAAGVLSDAASGINALQTELTQVHSETTDIQSETEVIQSLAVAIESFASDTYSDTTAIHTQTTAIASDTTTLASDLAEADFSDIQSLATKIYSDTTIIEAWNAAAGVLSDAASGINVIQSQVLVVKSDTSDIQSHLTVQDAVISDIQSDTNLLITRITEADWSDIISMLTKVYSDTTVIETVTSDIQSDTNVLHTTRAEPGQGSPAATATFLTKIDYLYKAWRNKKEQTATTHSLYDDAGTTVDQKATVSDDGTTATRGEMVTGP